MTSYVVLDSSFLLAAIDGDEPFHDDAAFLFRELSERKNVQILIPPLIIYEVIVTLRRKGVTSQRLEPIVLRLVNLPYVSILSLSELSAFKHAQHALNTRDQGSAMGTNDFVIFCLGHEFDALIVTFDVGMHKKCKKVYQHIFFPAETEEQEDDTALVLIHIDDAAGENIEDNAYNPFKVHV